MKVTAAARVPSVTPSESDADYAGQNPAAQFS
jgi:hypothetical protein